MDAILETRGTESKSVPVELAEDIVLDSCSILPLRHTFSNIHILRDTIAAMPMMRTVQEIERVQS